MFDFSIVTNWIHELLLSIMPEGLAIFIECVAVGVCLVALYAILAIILIYMERKVCGFFQCRLGPNRVGKWGSIQVVCDVLKMMTKEIFMPKGADHFLYNLAPFMVIIASFLTFSCLPISKGLEVLDFNVGVFFLLAASSIGVVGILPPATSAMLHNLSTLGVSLHSMSALPVAGQATKVLKDL